ncbi:MAG: TetR/AcrR family transcriptional regulator [Clostridia bacterium]|nr:TetR/AcrR family transcriptional regulator [Clostridia bacterium]
MARSTKVTDFLKECIADALLELLKEKSIDKITIDEITAKAGVGRASYFRYFKRKEDAITFKFIKMWENWTHNNDVKIRNSFAVENARTFFTYNYGIRDTLTLIYKNNLQSAIFDSFKIIMKPEEGSDTQEHYKAAFYSYGLFALLDEWVKRGFTESVDDMVVYFENLFNPILTHYKN